jgi:hypothetical protein
MNDTPQVLLAHHLKALKLPTFLREYDKVARQCATEGVDYPRFLLRSRSFSNSRREAGKAREEEVGCRKLGDENAGDKARDNAGNLRPRPCGERKND